jgi:hypothetical protein
MHTGTETRGDASKGRVIMDCEQDCISDSLSRSSLDVYMDFNLIRMFKSIRRNVSVFMIATDPRGMIRLTSSNAGLLLGCNPAELQGEIIGTLFDDYQGQTNDIMVDLEAEGELENNGESTSSGLSILTSSSGKADAQQRR